MTSIDALVAKGDPVDAELVSVLAAEGIDTLEDVRARGRDHWVGFFADRDGFRRDFVDLPAACGLTWESSASAERFQCPVDEIEIGVPAAMVAEKLGATTFADVFRSPQESVRLAMAERSGLLGELDELLARHGLSW